MDAESLTQVQHIVTSAITTAVTDLRRALCREIVDSREETKRHTGVLIEDVYHKLDLVIEGMQFLRQSDTDIRAEIAHESNETRALLKLSHGQLHHRVQDLEQRPGPAT